MNSKTPLFLMEQLIMILVFSLTAALCLQGFTLANRLSLRQEARTNGVLYTQNMAELLKSTSGNYEKAVNMFSQLTPECSVCLGKEITDRDSGSLLLITPLDSETPLFASARIQYFFEGDPLFEITVCWQEVSHE